MKKFFQKAIKNFKKSLHISIHVTLIINFEN